MRIEGWEHRLNELVEAARHRPYRIGHWDCALFAIEVAHALTGTDYGRLVRGRYRTEAGAHRLMRRLGGGGLADAVTVIVEREPSPVVRAHRGDPVLYRDPAGREHLGVCVGAEVAVLSPDGLAFVGRDQCESCWRV